MSGGANKGSFQLGVLQQKMGVEGIDYDIVTGISVGALNAGGLGMTPVGDPKAAIDWLVDFWLRKVDVGSIWRRHFPLGVLHSVWESSLYDSTPLWDLVREAFDAERINASGRHLAVGAVSLTSGELKFVNNSDPDFLEWMLASSAYPVAFRPVRAKGELWTDGGVMNVTPLGQAIRLGADEIDVIITSDPFKIEPREMKKPNTLSVALRVLDLMASRIMQHDIKVTGLKNDLARFEDRYRHVKVRLIYPSVKLSDDPFDFSVESMKRMMEQGRKDHNNVVVYD